MIRLTIPFPPSTNNLFKNVGRRRARTDDYNAWLRSAGWEINRQKPTPVAGPFRLTIYLARPDRRRRDASNYIKAAEDLIVKHRLVEDDSLAVSVHVEWEWEVVVPGGAATLVVEPFVETLQQARAA